MEFSLVVRPLYIVLLLDMYLLGNEKPTMRDIENLVVTKWAPQWKKLGRQLNIDHHLLAIIQHDHSINCVECCSRMLDEWLQQNTSDNTTWEILLNAIDMISNDDIPGMACMHALVRVPQIDLNSYNYIYGYNNTWLVPLH